ncbi:hypothetical protein HMPREF9348_05161 [Escherichia coli MS 145-7]|nr:hypothetical protein HMPREF9348_05161 [Escherichia coli MS 145-7]ESD75518.1 hypothetical protein HMPREF1610_00085 [Escherichia coli 908555]
MANENLDIDSKTAEELYEWYLDDKLIINRRYGDAANLLI